MSGKNGEEGGSEGHGTEVAFKHLNQLLQVQIPQIFSDFILDVAEINELHCLVQWTLDSGCLMLIEPAGTAKKSSEIILLNSAF